MLNYNKIESAINRDRTPKVKLATYLGIGESTLRSRLKRKNLTPNDVYNIAKFFDKPIGFFFDEDEESNSDNPGEAVVRHIKCSECIEKDKEIQRLLEELKELQAELLDLYRSKKAN